MDYLYKHKQPLFFFYVHGTLHRNSVSINVQQDATVHSLFYM